MSSSRGANKAQAVGSFTPSQSRGRRGQGVKEMKNLQRQLAEQLDLLARFQEKAAPPAGPQCTTCGGALELSGQYPDAGYLHASDADDTHTPTVGASKKKEETP